MLLDVVAAIINTGISGCKGFSPGEDPIYKKSGKADVKKSEKI